MFDPLKQYGNMPVGCTNADLDEPLSGEEREQQEWERADNDR